MKNQKHNKKENVENIEDIVNIENNESNLEVVNVSDDTNVDTNIDTNKLEITTDNKESNIIDKKEEKRQKKQKKLIDKLNKKIEQNKQNIIQKNEQNNKEENIIKEQVKNENSKKTEEKTSLKTKISNFFDEKTKKKIKGFIEATIYILCIISVIFANIYGPIYIQMIPLLFVLGFVGKLVYNRPVITTTFGMIVAICAFYMSGITDIAENLISSMCLAMYIALGEISAFFLKKSYMFYKKKTKRISKRAIISYVVSLGILGISVYLYNYTNSNYFELKKAKERLNIYLSENYNNEEFEIVDMKYNFLGERNFNFNVKKVIDQRIYEFTIPENEKFEIEDGYLKYASIEKEKNMNEKLIKFFKDKQLKEKYENVIISVKLSETDDYELEILKKEDKVTEENTLEFAKLVSSIINDIKDFEHFKEFEQIVISLKDKEDVSKSLTSYLYVERYINNANLDIVKDFEYIKKALVVEYID